MNPILHIESLKKSFQNFRLDGITLDLEPGTILGLIGPNGSGKTTTIKLIMNMLRPSAGEIRIFGLRYPKDEKAIKSRIGFVGEEHFFYGNKTVSWTGRFMASFYDRWDLDLFESLLTRFSIGRSMKTGSLSKGQKVRLSLALALAHHPSLAIMDEPTAGLDPIVRREVLEILRTTADEQEMSVIISSHITDDIARIADEVAFMVNGRIPLREAKDDLFSRWKRIHFKTGIADHPVFSMLTDIREGLFGSSGLTDRYPQIESDLADDRQRGNIKVEKAVLDDILISLVRGEKRCGT